MLRLVARFVLAALCTPACAHQRADFCPATGELTVLMTSGGAPLTPLAGDPTPSRHFVALRSDHPPQRVALTRRTSEDFQEVMHEIRPWPGPAVGDGPTIFVLGPYRGDPARLAYDCKVCDGHFHALMPDVWLHMSTVTRDGAPWLEWHAKAIDVEGTGIRYELRAVCADNKPIASGSLLRP